MSQKKYFELIEDNSAKFWEITLDDTKVLTRYGRIGANGQSTEKNEETTEKANVLCLKLIAEKTKKGYKEIQQAESNEVFTADSPTIMKLWEKIVNGESDSLRKYLSLFGPNQADRLVISRIIDRFRKAEITGEGEEQKLLVFLTPLWEDEENEDYITDITFSKPYEGAIVAGLPTSVIEACKIANGVEFESAGGGCLGYIGIVHGSFVGSGNWDPGCFDDEEIEGLEGAMDYGQNWICFNDLKKNKLGEPQLYFVSHEGGEPEVIKKANALSFGQVTLRVISQYFTEIEELDEVYS